MKAKRKLVFSVTLHEEVADWLRSLDKRLSLSGGIAKAQALLMLPGVLPHAIEAERAEEERERQRFAKNWQDKYAPRIREANAAAARTRAAAAEPPPLHSEVSSRTAPPPDERPSIDDVFGSVGDERDEQAAARKSRIEPGPAGSSRNEPGSVGAEGALHGSEATSVQEPSGDTREPEGAPGGASPAPVASTATEAVSGDPGRSELAGVAEPAF